MGDFSTANDVVAALAGTASNGLRGWYNKNSYTTAAGFFYSGWTAPGIPAAGATPGAAATPDDTTLGALSAGFLNAPGGGTTRLLLWSNLATSASTDVLFDRVAHMGGLSGTSVAAQTVSLGLATAAAAGRCAADGSDVEWFLEWYGATGSTAVTATISYTNQAGTSGRSTTVSIPASVPIGRLIPINVLQSGDTSIKSIESVTLSASTLTAGSFGVTAGHRLTPPGWTSGNAGYVYDFAGVGMPKVGNDPCLWMVSWMNAATYGTKTGMIVVGSRP